MATRPTIHPSLEGDAPISQPGAISASVGGRVSFQTDTPDVIEDAAEGTEAERVRREKMQAFITLAFDRWRTVDSAESELRKSQRECLDFVASDQWPQQIRQQRERDGRPCLTMNRLNGFVLQVTNEMRDARPGIEVLPVDNVTDPALAEVFQGLLQHIEANSDADVAYTRASKSQVRVGRGFFRIIPEYASDTGFEQELRIRSIRNHSTVYFDQASQEMDGSDARFCLIVEDIPIPEYDERWGEQSRRSLTEFSRVGEQLQTWMPEGKVRIAEYYCLVPKTRQIHQLKNGWVVDDDDLQKLQTALQQQMALDPQTPPMDLTPVRSRQVEGRQLTWALINGGEILEGNEDKTAGRELPGRWIPIIPVYGEEIDRDGRVDYRGIIKDAIDAQRMNNYWKSAEAETVALAPKAPFIAEESQIENHEAEWQQANVKNVAVLKYKGRSVDGHLLPAPQRNTAEPPIQAMAMLAMQMENDLRATVGFSYDVGASEKRVEQSGRAILARQAQGEKGNSHFSANLAISLRHAGRILLDLIPSYYDTPRVKRILGRDGQGKSMVLHSGNPEDAAKIAQEQGIAESQIHDLSAGRYDIRVTAGVSYASQRQQDQELVANALQTNPALMQVIGDLFFKTLDSPIAERISQRMAKALPPELRDGEEGKPPAIPPQLQQQMQQAQSLIDSLTQRVNELTDEKLAHTQDNETKIEIAKIQSQTTLAVAESKIVTERTLALLDARMRQIEQLTQIDMARLQAAQATQESSPDGQAPAPPPPSAPLPSEAMLQEPMAPPPMAPSPVPAG